MTRRKKSSEERWQELEAQWRAEAGLRPLPRRVATADDVLDAARRAPPEAWFGDKVFLSAILPYVTAADLLRLNREGAIVLHRADMVAAMDPSLVRRSEISTDGGYVTFHFVSVPETEQRAMHPNRTPRLRDGYADELTARVYWQESGENDWENVMLTGSDVGGATYLGSIRIEDAPHSVFRLHDGRTVAQLAHMARNAREPEPRFRLGDQVRDVDGSRQGTVSFVGQYDELIGGYRYRVLEADGTRKFWNETNMVLVKAGMQDNHKGLLRRNADLPRPRRTVDTSLARVSRMEREQRQRDKPFDPEKRYPRETKPHHFSLNPDAELTPFRMPDESVSTHWAIWYGPDGVEGDVATEAELSGSHGFTVREYQHVAGYFDEGTYDESTPFLVLETFVSMDDLAFEDARSDDEVGMLALRYAAAIGVHQISEVGGEESFAAELPR